MKVYPHHGKKLHGRSPMYWSTHKRVLCSSEMWQYWLWIQAPHKICQLRSRTHPWDQDAETEPAQMSLLRQHRRLKKVLENCPPCLAAEEGFLSKWLHVSYYTALCMMSAQLKQGQSWEDILFCKTNTQVLLNAQKTRPKGKEVHSVKRVDQKLKILVS